MAEEGDEDLEVPHQSQAGASSSAWPSPYQIDPATLARLSKQVAKAYDETHQREEELRRTGKLPMDQLPRRGSKKKVMSVA